MFWKRELLAEGFDEQWHYCFDHEVYVRLLLAGFICEHLPASLAAYRLHPASKTVSKAGLFDREFDEIAEIYEPKLSAADRRWSTATRYLRLSASASGKGEKFEAVRNLVRAALLHPSGLYHRPFWGCFRRIFRPPINTLAGSDT
jgi:hypothetical protein